jgi:hypothetical protein
MPLVRAAAKRFLDGKSAPENIVFRTRPGLAIAQLASGNYPDVAVSVTARIIADTIEIGDAYAARDILQTHGTTMTLNSWSELTCLVIASGLVRGELTGELLAQINAAVET